MPISRQIIQSMCYLPASCLGEFRSVTVIWEKSIYCMRHLLNNDMMINGKYNIATKLALLYKRWDVSSGFIYVTAILIEFVVWWSSSVLMLYLLLVVASEWSSLIKLNNATDHPTKSIPDTLTVLKSRLLLHTENITTVHCCCLLTKFPMNNMP